MFANKILSRLNEGDFKCDHETYLSTAVMVSRVFNCPFCSELLLLSCGNIFKSAIEQGDYSLFPVLVMSISLQC